jgi:hypothetical protein
MDFSCNRVLHTGRVESHLMNDIHVTCSCFINQIRLGEGGNERIEVLDCMDIAIPHTDIVNTK